MANVASSLLGSIHEDVQYKLTITDVEDSLLRVSSFTAIEELSVPFRYTVVVATDPESESVQKLEEALGRDASFTIIREGKIARVVHGIVTNVMPDGRFVGKTLAAVTFVLEPRISNLQFSGGFRIFQDMAVHEIVAELCKPEQIECLWYVHPVPSKREYCTQFNESDLEFITRIVSEEGMHFFFAHDEKKTTVTFVNEAKGYEEIEADLTVSFSETEGAVDAEHVRSIQRVQRVRVGAFEHRDYHFVQPGVTLLARAETAGKETTANSHKRELRGYPGRFSDNEMGKPIAQMRLDELRSDAFVVTGTASSLRFSAGRTFTLTGHREDGFNRALLLTYVVMEGAVQGALREGGFRATTKLTSFSAVPAEVTIHPQRLPKPSGRLQSGRVVGPKDGDPYVDEYGRVKVQFFWDRDGKFDEKSSCWIRMATPVAHADEGFWQAHKVGSEVLVGFIDDDIDRPIVMSAVYNPVQAQPHPLPGQVAKSTWKTKSVPGNAGFNEITQDNTAGKEVLFMHAQKDRSTVVLHNHAEKVGANQSVTVGANQSITVGANRTVTTGANETITVVAVRSETVKATEDVTVHKGRVHTVLEGNDVLNLPTGDHTVNIDTGNLTHNVSLTQTTEATDISDHATNAVSAVGDTTVYLQQGKATYTMEANTVFVSCPSGSISLAENKIVLDAVDEIILQCGSSSISLKKDGTIAVTGSKQVSVSSAQSALSLEPAKASLNGPMTDIAAKAILKVNGALVKIN